VITGGPGTGKTTLAVQLLLELLPPPGEPPSGPVPVLFSLGSWAPDTQPLQDWLTAQLRQTYPALRAIAADAAGALVAQGRLLPILDGLDEVHPERRAGIIAALNTSLPPDGGLVLTSRRAEYRTALAAAGDVLTAAAVISPLALTPTDAATFLRGHLAHNPHRPAWDGVLEALTGGSAPNLADVTATPLRLWLIRTVYVDTRRPPGPLTDAERHPTVAALQAHLLDNLIPAVIDSRPPLPRRRRYAPDAPFRPTREHEPEDLRRWLTTIAETLRGAGTRDWLWFELAQQTFPTLRARLALSTVIGLISGLIFGLIFGLNFGLMVGLTVGLAGLMMDPVLPPRHVFLGGGDVAERSASPGLSYRKYRARSLIELLTFGLTAGLTVGLAWELAVRLVQVRVHHVILPVWGWAGLTGEPTGLTFGLAVGLFFGLGWGLTNGAWFPFLAAALRQTTRRRLPAPWRVMAVLDDAYRLGLLRTVGPAYQFRHAELQDHLAPPQPEMT
jgi:hypothetical protein